VSYTDCPSSMSEINRLHILLAIVAVIGVVAYPVALIVTDTTPGEFEERAEDWEKLPGPNAMWYVVAMMPMYYFAGIVAAGVLIMTWLSPKRWSGGSE